MQQSEIQKLNPEARRALDQYIETHQNKVAGNFWKLLGANATLLLALAVGIYEVIVWSITSELKETVDSKIEARLSAEEQQIETLKINIKQFVTSIEKDYDRVNDLMSSQIARVTADSQDGIRAVGGVLAVSEQAEEQLSASLNDHLELKQKLNATSAITKQLETRLVPITQQLDDMTALLEGRDKNYVEDMLAKLDEAKTKLGVADSIISMDELLNRQKVIDKRLEQSIKEDQKQNEVLLETLSSYSLELTKNRFMKNIKSGNWLTGEEPDHELQSYIALYMRLNGLDSIDNPSKLFDDQKAPKIVSTYDRNQALSIRLIE